MFELRPFRESDFQRLITWVNSPELLAQWGGHSFSFPLDKLQLKKHLSEFNQNAPKELIFASQSVNTPETIGHIELNRIDYEKRTAAICRVFIDPKREIQGSALS